MTAVPNKEQLNSIEKGAEKTAPYPVEAGGEAEEDVPLRSPLGPGEEFFPGK